MSPTMTVEFTIPNQPEVWHPVAAEKHIGAPGSIRTSDIISALSYALDLTEGRPMGHSVRSCMIGMRIAQQIGMPAEMQADLYYALLLKDGVQQQFQPVVSHSERGRDSSEG